MPLVKFFHCVSFLNQTLFQSSSSYTSFSSALFILLLSFYASFHFLSGCLPLLPNFPFLLFHFKHCKSLHFFLISSQSFANSLFSFCTLPSSPAIHPFSPSTLSCFSALFSTPAKVIFWVDGLMLSCMQTTLKSLPISDQAPGQH